MKRTNSCSWSTRNILHLLTKSVHSAPFKLHTYWVSQHEYAHRSRVATQKVAVTTVAGVPSSRCRSQSAVNPLSTAWSHIGSWCHIHFCTLMLDEVAGMWNSGWFTFARLGVPEAAVFLKCSKGVHKTCVPKVVLFKNSWCSRKHGAPKIK